MLVAFIAAYHVCFVLSAFVTKHNISKFAQFLQDRKATTHACCSPFKISVEKGHRIDQQSFLGFWVFVFVLLKQFAASNPPSGWQL